MATRRTAKSSPTSREDEQEASVESAVTKEKPGLPYLPITRSKREVPLAEKPLWRGWIHAVTFPLALASGIVLICVANGAAAKISCAIFMTSSLLLFGNSALYHRFNWSPRVKLALKRIDHSNIFLLIAGTYTPLTVLCLPQPKAATLLAIVWGVSVVGILGRIFWVGAPRWLYVSIYVLTGFGAFMYIVDFFQASVPAMTLVLVGGLCYTVGAVVYGFKKPNPIPGVFGFHEIFHALTVIAFVCTSVALYLVAVNPPVGIS